MNLQFYLRFHTQFGQSLWICGNTEEMGNDDPSLALPMEYLDDEFWFAAIDIKKKELAKEIRYYYFLKNKDGEITYEWGKDRAVELFRDNLQEIQLVDTWNHAGEYENSFFTAPFRNVLLKPPAKKKARADRKFTHIFRVKAPLLQANESVCLLGSGAELGDWDTTEPVLLGKEADWWTCRLDLSSSGFPLAYKYGVYNNKEKQFTRYEEGNNRLLYSDAAKKKLSLLHDGFVHLPNTTWKGAGVTIPVFSLRSKSSLGVGEFTDLKLLVDWAKKTGLKLIQILPVNDTIATHSWMDSYPYAAISAFALHPIYINLATVAGKEYSDSIDLISNKQKQLNEQEDVNYEEVIRLKSSVLKEL